MYSVMIHNGKYIFTVCHGPKMFNLNTTECGYGWSLRTKAMFYFSFVLLLDTEACWAHKRFLANTERHGID